MKAWIAARLNWALWALCLACSGAAAGFAWRNHSAGADPGGLAVGLLFLALVMTFATVGALVAAKRPGNVVGRLFAALALAFAFVSLADEYVTYAVDHPNALPAANVMAWIGSWLGGGSGFAPLALVLLRFPNGRPPSPRWRVVSWLVRFGVLTAFLGALAPGPLPNLEYAVPIENPFGITGAGAVLEPLNVVGAGAIALALLAAAASLVWRFRASRGVERQQLKWLALGAVLLVAFLVAIPMVDAVALPSGAWEGVLFVAAFAPLPISVGVAILRHNLYDIDRLLSRALVYGALTAAVIGSYVVVVGAVAMALGGDGALGASLLATGVVAVLFQPVRDRLQRHVNRFVYGERDDPYAVLSRLGRRLEERPASGAVVQAVVETVAGALKLPYVAIEREQHGVSATVGTSPKVAIDPLRIPLTFQGGTLGAMLVAPRDADEPFTAAERRLLDDLARLAAAAVHAEVVMADLRRSRERLVTAREEERRRLRNDLHDGLGPVLSGLTLKLEAGRNVFAHDPEIDAFLAEMSGRTQAAVADVRRLVYALRPPALDELGLVAALQQGMTHHESAGSERPRVSIEAPEGLPPLSAAVEVAAYRIAQEAITNAIRHAAAGNCVVRLTARDGGLLLEVTDDGLGIAAARPAGIGLISMRERAEELGGTFRIEPVASGGTRVEAWLPSLPAQSPTAEEDEASGSPQFARAPRGSEASPLVAGI